MIFVFIFLLQMCAIMAGLWMYGFLNDKYLRGDFHWVQKTMIWMMGLTLIGTVEAVSFLLFMEWMNK